MTDLAIEKVAPYSLGEIARLHMAGELKVAERAYSEYLVENPSNMSALNLFGICCNDLGHYKKAERVFEHLLISAPEIVEARIHLAQSRFVKAIAYPLFKRLTVMYQKQQADQNGFFFEQEF